MVFYRIFYNRNREQRKWLIIPTVLLPIAFSVWGIMLSRKANVLSIAASNNREQIDTLISMVKKLQLQNELLSKSVRLQEDQVNVNRDQQSFTLRPKLSVVMLSGEISEDTSNIVVQILNEGGNIYHLKYKLSPKVAIDSSVLNYDSQVSSGSRISNIPIKGLRHGSGIQFSFVDELGKSYTQQLKWRYDLAGEEINFGPLILKPNQPR